MFYFSCCICYNLTIPYITLFVGICSVVAWPTWNMPSRLNGLIIWSRPKTFMLIYSVSDKTSVYCSLITIFMWTSTFLLLLCRLIIWIVNSNAYVPSRNVVSVLTSWSQDAISNVSISWKCGKASVLVSDWKSNVPACTIRSSLQVDQYTFL